MWPDRVSNPGPLAHELDALSTVPCGPAKSRSEVPRKNIIKHREVSWEKKSQITTY